MNCRKVGDLLSAYIEGEVTGRQAVALEAHVGHCSACGEELETLRAALALLAAPKALARPEGLLEEFKAKYLPEAESAAAPGWGIRLPVMPRFEWPSLGRVMVPMGGLAAAAAAAFLVALHSQPLVGVQGPVATRPAVSRLAVLPDRSDSARVGTTDAGADGVSAKLMSRVERSASPEPARAREPIPAHLSFHRAGAVRHDYRQRFRHRAVTFAAATHRSHRRHQRSTAYQLATRPRLLPPVDVGTLQEAIRQHEEAVPSPEMQWQDQVVMIRRTATPAPTDDGYGEASCKDLATGKTEKSIAIGDPSVTATPAGTPLGGAGGGQ